MTRSMLSTIAGPQESGAREQEHARVVTSALVSPLRVSPHGRANAAAHLNPRERCRVLQGLVIETASDWRSQRGGRDHAGAALRRIGAIADTSCLYRT